MSCRDASNLLGKSEVIASLIGVRLVGEQREALRVVFFRTMLVARVHEWTHHIHGHVGLRGLGSVHFDETLQQCPSGDTESQALEVDADGYAVHLVLNNLIAGSARASAVTTFLQLEVEPVSVQDEVLLACFVVAVGAFLYIRQPVTVNSTNIYTLTHPPQAERMNFVMTQAMRWCQPSRPGLAAWMTLDRFQKLVESFDESGWWGQWRDQLGSANSFSHVAGWPGIQSEAQFRLSISFAVAISEVNPNGPNG